MDRSYVNPLAIWSVPLYNIMALHVCSIDRQVQCADCTVASVVAIFIYIMRATTLFLSLSFGGRDDVPIRTKDSTQFIPFFLFFYVFTEWNEKNNGKKKDSPDSNKFPRTMLMTRKNCSALQ